MFRRTEFMTSIHWSVCTHVLIKETHVWKSYMHISVWTSFSFGQYTLYKQCGGGQGERGMNKYYMNFFHIVEKAFLHQKLWIFPSNKPVSLLFLILLTLLTHRRSFHFKTLAFLSYIIKENVSFPLQLGDCKKWQAGYNNIKLQSAIHFSVKDIC